jgi:hypothetical protein
VSADGYADQSARVDASSEPSIAEVRLERLGTLVVHVPGDVPIRSARATGLRGAATDHDRDVDFARRITTLSGLPPGRWRTSFDEEDEDSLGPERECDLRPGSIASITLEPRR